MNTLNFLQRVGFPMDVNILDKMQTAYKLFNGLGALAGDLSIIKGCELTGNTVSNGLVYINGEVIEFIGGVASQDVIIVQEAQTAEFENGELHEVHYTRYATFGVATTSYPWSNFKRAFHSKDIPNALAEKVDTSTLTAILERIKTLEAKNAVFQAGGGMVLWNKPVSEIPIGWAEVTNWRGRMPVGWDYADTDFDLVGKNGGAKTHRLTIDEMPSHSHGVIGYAGVEGNNSREHINSPTNGDSYDHTSYVGGNKDFTIMNPYRVVLFIEFIG